MVLISMLGILLTPSVAMTTHNIYGQAVDTIELLDNDTAVQPILPMTISPIQPSNAAAAVAATPLIIGELEVIPPTTAEATAEQHSESDGESEDGDNSGGAGDEEEEN